MISREFVLKNFNKKLLEAKRQRAKEVKFTLQEIDDLTIDGGDFNSQN